MRPQPHLQSGGPVKSHDPDIKLVEQSMNVLREHFDTVQIFVSRKDEDGTVNATQGVGNWFACYGQVKDWIHRSEENTRIEARKNYDEDEG